MVNAFTLQNIAPTYNVVSIKFLIIHPLSSVLCTLSQVHTIVRDLESYMLVLASCVLHPVSTMLARGSSILGSCCADMPTKPCNV